MKAMKKLDKFCADNRHSMKVENYGDENWYLSIENRGGADIVAAQSKSFASVLEVASAQVDALEAPQDGAKKRVEGIMLVASDLDYDIDCLIKILAMNLYELMEQPDMDNTTCVAFTNTDSKVSIQVLDSKLKHVDHVSADTSLAEASLRLRIINHLIENGTHNLEVVIFNALTLLIGIKYSTSGIISINYQCQSCFGCECHEGECEGHQYVSDVVIEAHNAQGEVFYV